MRQAGIVNQASNRKLTSLTLIFFLGQFLRVFLTYFVAAQSLQDYNRVLYIPQPMPIAMLVADSANARYLSISRMVSKGKQRENRIF